MKKRVRNKNHKLLIKRKNSKWIILNNEKFFLSILLLGIIVVGLFVTFNSHAFGTYSGSGELAANNFVDAVYNWMLDIYNNYLLPGEVGSLGELGTPGMVALITFIGVIVFGLIIFEITSFLPLSGFTNGAIAIGVIIILAATQLMRNIIWGLMSFITLGAGVGGTIGMVMTGVFLVVIAIAIFTGATWAHEFLDKIRYNKELQAKTTKANRAAANISALNKEAAAVKFK
ncbi:hypothetical protein J4429_02220 [Candidatus Pacearchaeota archaeon]|nr:hypothetical protein [Candidatus Pacearchaeota archaeon]